MAIRHTSPGNLSSGLHGRELKKHIAAQHMGKQHFRPTFNSLQSHCYRQKTKVNSLQICLPIEKMSGSSERKKETPQKPPKKGQKEFDRHIFCFE